MKTVNHLLDLDGFTQPEIIKLVSDALSRKKALLHKQNMEELSGKAIGLLFEKPSTRTRVSFEAAVIQLGGTPVFMDSSQMQLTRGETVADTAKVLSRYLDALVIRTFSQDRLLEFAENSTTPVINALTDRFHPCQILSDLMTVYEKKGRLKGLKLAYFGDGNNIANTLLVGCSKTGMDIAVASPYEYMPEEEIIKASEKYGAASGSKVLITEDPVEAATGADILYADVWVSMGQEKKTDDSRKIFGNYQINEKLLTNAKKDAIFMHCLPAHRGEEVTAGIIDGKHSVVFDQAENRLHLQKAILAAIVR